MTIDTTPHRAELQRILRMTEPTPDMLRAAAERPAMAGGRINAILMKHRRRKKPKKAGTARWLHAGRS